MTAPTIVGEGVLGHKVSGDVPHGLDVFDLPESVSTVEYESDEMTAVCPVTSQPDWYTCKITLTRTTLGVESKSLKLYLQSYRNEGAFCEALADTIALDIIKATGAGNVDVLLTQKPRGGITIRARSSVWNRNRFPAPGTVPKISQSVFNMERCDDGEGDTQQDVPVRGSAPTAEPPREVP